MEIDKVLHSAVGIAITFVVAFLALADGFEWWKALLIGYFFTVVFACTNELRDYLNFGYDFTLSSQDSTRPARITEYRNGKPFREIVAENATYTEKKSQKDSSNHKHSSELYGRINELQTQLEKQQTKISALEKITIRQKQDNIKLANNFKYLLWAVILFGIVYIGSSSGVFKAFKRLLNRG